MNLQSLLAPTPPPLTPDASTARQWLLDELAKPQYQAAKPTWFDLASQAVENWFTSLFSATGHGVSGFVPVALTVLFVILLVVAFLIFGRPRLNRRSKPTQAIVDAGDVRDSNDLRRSAASAAQRSDWTLAIEELFRALAKDLAERSVLSLSPGTTARDFAARAATVFPDRLSDLSSAASRFDQVRYLGMTGTQADYVALVALDGVLRSTRPASFEAIGEFAVPR